MLFCFRTCEIYSRYLLNLQEEHDNIRGIKGKDQPLEWSDYKSMPFTQCVSSLESLFYFFKSPSCPYHGKGKMPSGSFIFSNKHIYLLKRTFQHNRMSPLLQVISETLRVANLISGVFRRANTDIHFKGYFYRSYL